MDDLLPASTEESPEVRLACRIAEAAPGLAREAEGQLYRLLAPRAQRYGLRHLRDAQAAADLMQQVMMLTLERLRSGRLRDPRRVVSFVLGACRLTVKGQRRRSLEHEALLRRYPVDAALSTDMAIAPRLDRQRVADCLERLSARERSVLVLTFYDEQPSEAVGRDLGLSAGNVRVIRCRSLEKLRRCIDSEAGTR